MKVNVLKSEEEVPLEIFEAAIVDIAAAAKKLLASRLTERAIVILIHEVHASDLPGAAEHASGDWDTEHECDRPDCRRCGRYEP